ncbi:thymosin beta-10-like [Psammomys obesus]|nr:thymosin beta-10-like [Psammomys obesus]
MADKLDMGEIASFGKAKMKKTEMQEKNTLLTKDTIEQEKRSEIS